MNNTKILAVVKFNDGEATVLDKSPRLTYTRYDRETIVGTDGVFYQFYKYEQPSMRFKAFAGREFELVMADGEVVKCNGQWWDGVSNRAVKEFDINDSNNKLVYATANSIDNLKNCYVYIGYNSLSSDLEKFRDTYNGEVYNYWEYQKILRGEAH